MKKISVTACLITLVISLAFGAGNTYVGTFIGDGGGLTNVVGTGGGGGSPTNSAGLINTPLYGSLIMAYSPSTYTNINSTTITNPITLGTPWTNTYGFDGFISINYTLVDSAVTGSPGLNITNLTSGEFFNATNSFVLSGSQSGSRSMRVWVNDVVITGNGSSGSASSSITSSFLRP